MSEALCQCGHPKEAHTATAQSGTEIWRQCVGACPCQRFTPPPTREPIRLTDEERESLLFGFGIRFHENADHTRFAQGVAAVESILAARLAGGPTLADLREQIARELQARADYIQNGASAIYTQALRDAAKIVLSGEIILTKSDARTPESEDTE